MNKNHLIFLLFITFTLSSCFTGALKNSTVRKYANSEFSVEYNAIPKEFGKENNIMIFILDGFRTYDKYLKKSVTENYFGEYVILSKTEMNAPNYNDKTIYRYYFHYTYGSQNKKRFYVYDRLEEKMYQSGADFSLYAAAMEVYIKNLEKQRLINQQ